MKNANSFTSVAAKAFMRDKENNLYEGESLFLALLLHCSGTERNAKAEHDVAEMLDDVNIVSDKRRK